MQTVEHKAGSIMHAVRSILLGAGALLVLVAILWRLTDWHHNAPFGLALITSGTIVVALGLVSLLVGRSSDDVKLTEGEIEMRSWDRRDGRRFTSRYAELVPISLRLIGIGFVAIGLGAILNQIFH